MGRTRPTADSQVACPAGWLDDPRRERRAVAVLLLVALALRVLWVLENRASPWFDQPMLDGMYHVGLAKAFAFGGAEYHPGPFFRAPLYPWFLGACFWLFGEDYLVPRLLQALLGCGTVLVTWALGRRLFGKAAGYVAGWFAATYWVLIYFDGELLLETQSVFLNTLALWLTVRLADAPRPRGALVAGLVWGLAAITRPNVLAFLPVTFFWLWRRAGRRWTPALALTAGTLAPILPVTAWNTFVEGDFVLIASQGGVNFWIGNNPWSDGGTAIVPGTRGGWWQGYHDATALAEQEAGRPLKASEVSAHYSGKAWRFIRENPATALSQLWHKVRLFAFHRELGNNHDPHFHVDWFGSVLRWLPLGFSFALGFGLLGMVVARARVPGRGLVVLYVVVYSATVVAFFVNSRFRLQIVPPLLVFAAAACTWLVAAARARRWPEALAGLGAAGGVLALSLATPPDVHTSAGGGMAQLGYAEAARGNVELGRKLLEESIRLEPDNLPAYVHLAHVLEEQGHVEDAIRVLRATLDRSSAPDAVESLLALHQRQQAQPGQDAQRHRRDIESFAEQVRRVQPQLEAPYYHMARVRHAQGRAAEAVELAREALQRDRRSFRSALLLGEVLGEQGLHQPAAAALEHALDVRDVAKDPEQLRRLERAFARSLGALGHAQRLREVQQLIAAELAQ